MLKEVATVIGIRPGIVGCGVADRLAQMGWRDLVIGGGGPLFRAGHPQVALASSCSGHGLKFASVVSEILPNVVADVKAPCGTSIFNLCRLTRLPGRSLRRAMRTETGSAP